MHYVTGSTIGKKMGLNLESIKSADGERVYRVLP